MICSFPPREDILDLFGYILPFFLCGARKKMTKIVSYFLPIQKSALFLGKIMESGYSAAAF
jgi:hypothetical protein